MSNRTRFAGLYDAIEYNYGGAGPAAPGPLRVLTGNAVAGAATLILDFGQVELSDGTTAGVLNANAPITVGSGATVETVTPTAVSNPSPGVYGTATVTATFANVHGGQEQVASGTFGLQEAINAAAAAGGGTVIVSTTWALYGGTSAMIAAATLPAGVTISDNRTGGGVAGSGVRQASVTLTNAQILGMSVTPVQIIPAQGAGSLINVVDATFIDNSAGVAYANGGAIQLSYGAGVTNPASATVAATFLTSPTVKQLIKVAGAIGSVVASAILNTAVNITNATAPFITGTGTLTVKVNYTVTTGN